MDEKCETLKFKNTQIMFIILVRKYLYMTINLYARNLTTTWEKKLNCKKEWKLALNHSCLHKQLFIIVLFNYVGEHFCTTMKTKKSGADSSWNRFNFVKISSQTSRNSYRRLILNILIISIIILRCSYFLHDWVFKLHFVYKITTDL